MATPVLLRATIEGSQPESSAAAQRREFDAFFGRWMPRVYRFASRRLEPSAEAEAATCAALARAVALGLAAGGDEIAARMLAITREEVARRGGRRDATA